jgi:putative transposase
VILETLNVRGMLSNHHLARSLSNASMSELHRQIDYKVIQPGGTVIRVGQWEPTSKRCSNRSCGAVVDNLPLSVRFRNCTSYGCKRDRDVKRFATAPPLDFPALSCIVEKPGGR